MQKVLVQSVAAAGAVLPLGSGAAWAQAPSDADRYAWGPHMMWWGEGWYAMIFGPLLMILFFAVLVAVTVLLVRGMGGTWPGTTQQSLPGRTPLDILKERFARGEIDKEEFEERRRVLGE